MRPGPGARPRSYKTEAIVLKSIAVRDADRLVTVLTPQLGKLPATVRGARRVNSRLGGHLDLFNRVELTLALGHRIDVVTGAESIESFGALKSDLDRTAIALYLMELTDAMLPEAAPHSRAYDLVLQALRWLNGTGPAVAMPRYVELRLLEDSGYLPELQNCLVCGKSLEPGHHRFAPALGGVTDDTCVVSAGQVLPLSVDALKVLRHFAREGFEAGVHVTIDGHLALELENILEASVHNVLEREVSSASFIEHLRRLKQRVAGS
jgi:DNA repair protein RecO (recombination protein O)